jgi:RNA polymerase sigma-70 factor (ECF subfamily)
MPEIQERAAQPYVAVRRTVTMTTIPEIADKLPVVFGWLGAQGIAPAGPPFLRYNVIDMARELEMEAGIPVATEVEGDGEVHGGVLPAGRYATALHHGHPEGLADATRDLLAWAAEQGLAWDKVGTPRGERWAARLESYLSDPAEVPDMKDWETVLAFKLAD